MTSKPEQLAEFSIKINGRTYEVLTGGAVTNDDVGELVKILSRRRLTFTAIPNILVWRGRKFSLSVSSDSTVVVCLTGSHGRYRYRQFDYGRAHGWPEAR